MMNTTQNGNQRKLELTKMGNTTKKNMKQQGKRNHAQSGKYLLTKWMPAKTGTDKNMKHHLKEPAKTVSDKNEKPHQTKWEPAKTIIYVP